MSTAKAAQSKATRAELVAVARKLFTERGYANTPTEELVHAAGVSRGALYHHFRDKRALFEAVFEDVESDLMVRLASVAKPLPDADVWTNFVRGFDAFLDACLEPDLQQIVLIDGPSVLGWEAWREIEGRYGLAAVSVGLLAAMEAGFVATQPVEPLAHLILAAVNEAGLVIARSDDVKAARKQTGAAFRGLLEGLRGSTA